MTRIATRDEVAELFAGLFQPPKAEATQGGSAVTVTYQGESPIVIKRGSAVSSRRSTHSNR